MFRAELMKLETSMAGSQGYRVMSRSQRAARAAAYYEALCDLTDELFRAVSLRVRTELVEGKPRFTWCPTPPELRALAEQIQRERAMRRRLAAAVPAELLRPGPELPPGMTGLEYFRQSMEQRFGRRPGERPAPELPAPPASIGNLAPALGALRSELELARHRTPPTPHAKEL